LAPQVASLAGNFALEHSMKNYASLLIVTLIAVLVSAPAFAGLTPISVPEPMSLSLLAGGVVAIIAAKRLRRK